LIFNSKFNLYKKFNFKNNISHYVLQYYVHLKYTLVFKNNITL